MRVIIQSHHLKLTPAITAYLEKKIGKLEELLGRSEREHEAEIYVNESSRRGGKETFKLGAIVSFRGKKIFTEEQGYDLYALADAVEEELRRQLTKQKERPLDFLRRQALRAKRLLRGEGDSDPGVSDNS